MKTKWIGLWWLKYNLSLKFMFSPINLKVMLLYDEQLRWCLANFCLLYKADQFHKGLKLKSSIVNFFHPIFFFFIKPSYLNLFAKVHNPKFDQLHMPLKKRSDTVVCTIIFFAHFWLQSILEVGDFLKTMLIDIPIYIHLRQYYNSKNCIIDALSLSLRELYSCQDRKLTTCFCYPKKGTE